MENLVQNLTEVQSQGMKKEFVEKRMVLSFDEYLALVVENPKIHIRNAPRFFADMVEHFGSYEKRVPTGVRTRYRIFDAAFENGDSKVLGHERVQEDLVRLFNNFVRAGRVDRLVLLHGPNGSAKTSLIHALTQAAETFSHLEEGALYRFNWVFPAKKAVSGSMGFSGPLHSDEAASYAHLAADAIDARIPCEYKDHPLLLLSQPFREILFKQIREREGLGKDFYVPEFLRKGELSSKNKKIFDALLTTYQGDVREVLKHIQVVRFYLSKRYRTGLASVEPQMSVDAHARQVTADQSLASLPTSLRHLVLFESTGPLADANRGLIEYSDLLKRPIESWKYLLSATELGQASLETLTMFFDLLMVASSNELHLASFREYPDWPSFKGRFELVKVPYLLRVSDEMAIYEHQIPKALSGLHMAPHCFEIAATWAVLTRLEPPHPEKYPEHLREIVRSLSPLEKLDLYESGQAPERLTQKEARELRAMLTHMYHEYDHDHDYEGRFGASVREIRMVLLNAAQDSRFDHLQPVAIFDELRRLVKNKTSYEFLRREPRNGFRDAEHFIDVVQKRYLRKIEEEIRQAAGLVEADSHRQLFERYIKNVSAWTKRERLLNPQTNKVSDPDLDLLARVEHVLIAKGESVEEFRRSLIGQIGAFGLENPDKPVDYDFLFFAYLRRLKESYYLQQQKVVEQLQRNLLALLDNDMSRFDQKEKEQTQKMYETFLKMGYNAASARQAIAYVLSERQKHS